MSDTQVVKNKAAEWDENLKKVEEFAKTNSRWPSTTAKAADGATPDVVAQFAAEKELAQWWSRAKYYFNKFEESQKAPGMNAERAALIRNLISKFESFERDGVWNTRYSACSDVISKTGKVWSYQDKENDKNLRWWNQQKTFYRKFRSGIRIGGMTAERADRIEVLLKNLGEATLAQQPMQAESNQSQG